MGKGGVQSLLKVYEEKMIGDTSHLSVQSDFSQGKLKRIHSICIG